VRRWASGRKPYDRAQRDVSEVHLPVGRGRLGLHLILGDSLRRLRSEWFDLVSQTTQPLT
jgi:hypothetical protein